VYNIVNKKMEVFNMSEKDKVTKKVEEERKRKLS